MQPAQFSYYPSQPGAAPAINLVRQYAISDSRIWYAAFLPAIARFTEIYASNRTLGILVWSLCLILGVAACLLDRKYLGTKVPEEELKGLGAGLAVLPPAYMLKRNSVLHERSSAAAVCLIMLVFAACTNGFTKAALLDDSALRDQVKEGYWTYIGGFEDCSDIDEMVGETLGNCADKISKGSCMDWDQERKNDYVTVTATMDYDGDLKIVFGYSYDGYAAGDIKVESMTLDGKTYEDRDAVEQLRKLIGASDDNESESEDESEEDESSDSEADDEDESAKEDEAA